MVALQGRFTWLMIDMRHLVRVACKAVSCLLGMVVLLRPCCRGSRRWGHEVALVWGIRCCSSPPGGTRVALGRRVIVRAYLFPVPVWADEERHIRSEVRGSVGFGTVECCDRLTCPRKVSMQLHRKCFVLFAHLFKEMARNPEIW